MLKHHEVAKRVQILEESAQRRGCYNIAIAARQILDRLYCKGATDEAVFAGVIPIGWVDVLNRAEQELGNTAFKDHAGLLHVLAKSRVRKQVWLAALFEQCNGDVVGVEFQHVSREPRWAAVLPDAAYPFRVQLFDTWGFVGHHCGSLEWCIDFLVDQHFLVCAKGVLERLVETESWKIGENHLAGAVGLCGCNVPD